VNRDYSVSNELWAAVAPYFPIPDFQGDKEQRLFFDAVVFMLRQSLSWRMLPEHFGNWNAVFVRFNRYAKAGCGTEC